MHLGVEQHSGSIFEGTGLPELLVQPKPVVSQCLLVESEDDWRKLPRGLSTDPMRWLFREDSFDPVTRVRRGRLYQPWGGEQPAAVSVLREPSPDSMGLVANHATHRALTMYRYHACTALLLAKGGPLGRTLVIGSGDTVSTWKVVQVERLVSDEVLVTLKAKTAFGVIPDLNAAKIPEHSRRAVQQAVDRAIDSAFRETAVSVVDQCRNAMAMVLSHFLLNRGEPDGVLRKELGQLASMLLATNLLVPGCAAQIVARMHSRGKGNEQYANGLPEPGEEDAEFAVHALGLVIREAGWAA